MRNPRDYPPEKGARSQGVTPEEAWRGVAVTKARLKCMKRLRNQDLGFPEDHRYFQGLVKKKKTDKGQEWHMRRVIRMGMTVKIGDGKEHLKKAKEQKAEARKELISRYGKRTMKLRRAVMKLNTLDKVTRKKEDRRFESKFDHLKKKFGKIWADRMERLRSRVKWAHRYPGVTVYEELEDPELTESLTLNLLHAPPGRGHGDRGRGAQRM